MSYMQKQAKASLPKTASVAACCPASVPAVGSHAGMTCHVVHAKAGKGKLTQNCIHGSLLPSFQTSSCFPCWYNNGSTTSDHLQQLLVMTIGPICYCPMWLCPPELCMILVATVSLLPHQCCKALHSSLSDCGKPPSHQRILCRNYCCNTHTHLAWSAGRVLAEEPAQLMSAQSSLSASHKSSCSPLCWKP